ncbi:Maf family nucleotide pyrophosphatase [Flagellimonas sp. HMM57]|uniref:Maf family nucleotide pyrophosphatase n=1 Tax=unclassified Flagellimonas TaxID=2644544 RepID=UPI0013D5B19F|nr:MULTISPECIES: Maf family nucleotide pyrophosphatase [unclassified Flagellimonas]UII76060.1 Maf family nucleotide pyrophosphatase [Flagellimonas sp. HMM57]
MIEDSPLKGKLKDYKLILGSGSPRRKKFLEEMGLDFEVRPKSVEEIYPDQLQGEEIASYLAKLKANPFQKELEANEIVLTSDTVVWHKGKSLAKAEDKTDAFNMLQTLSNDWHEVITAVCFTFKTIQEVVTETTLVRFKELTSKEIDYYIDNYKPYDKAGAYGIQEWIGLIGVSEIKGSYNNVVGLPTQLVYKTLTRMVS